MSDGNPVVREPATAAERVKHLLDSALLAELNALAWLPAFNNADDHGRWDPGWSCRDHTVVLAALLTARGVDAYVVHGANIFVQGPTSAGEAPTGFGNVPRQGGGHSWVHVPTFGTVDVSPRLDERAEGWRPMSATGLVGTEWQITGLSGQVIVAENAQQYDEAVAIASNAVDTATAIYWPDATEPFRVGMLDVDYVDSPLAHRLSEAAGPDCYLKLAAHLIGLSRGERRPLARISQRKAWRFINEVSDSLVDELREAIAV